MEKINSFRNEYFFLSNFYEVDITYNGITYKNNEAAFQAQKTDNEEVRKQFANLTPKSAKRKGRKVDLVPYWDINKFGIMKDICMTKFIQNPDLREKLLSTGDTLLEEGNNWGDRIWGTVNGKGQNNLGKILMQVRDEIRNNKIGNLVKGVNYD